MDKKHAAVCLYCGESVIFDTRKITDIASAHEKLIKHDQSCPMNPLVIRIAELEKALEPFAREYRNLSGLSPSGRPLFDREDLRRAAAILTSKRGDA
jgi:hypothetical protein